jgi:signal transduction histidine kinase
VIITFVVLLFLNIYCSQTSQELFYRSKQAAMVERCLIVSADLSELEVLNNAAVGTAVKQIGSAKATRIIVTDTSAKIIFDTVSNDTFGNYALFPEILNALDNNNVFTWNYRDGVMLSRCATPIYIHGRLTGCVYMMEHDPEQGALIASLQRNIMSITLVLETAVILFSITFSSRFSQRLKRIRSSMRIIRNGDYSHKVKVGGRDELTLLGREFNELTERLHTSESKRRQFVSDASHELKTPLASIKLLSDSILQNDMDMPTVREFVEDIGNEAERLNRLSTKLLSLSKIDSQEELSCEIVNIEPTVDRVIRMLSTIAEENHITITKDIHCDSPILIQEDDLYEIAFNLAENAIKYNTPGGALKISLYREQDDAVLEVSDTGVGIPDDALPHLFERFFRVDKARSRKSGGSGLGLSIVRNLVTRNNGMIDVSSTCGKGSVFTVRFPVFDVEEAIE